MLKKVLAISCCAFFGGALRELFTVILNTANNPWYTVIVNLSGAFLLGLLVEGLPALFPISDTWSTALGVGLIGSFTTFSTFSLTAIQLFSHQKLLFGFLYVAINLLGGLLAADLGNLLTQKIIHRQAGRWQ